MSGALAGKVILITGAAGGIGRAHAHACGRAGATLLLNDLGCDMSGSGADPDAVERVAEEIRALGARVLTDCADVAAPETADLLVERALSTYGALHGAIGAAGVVAEDPIVKLDEPTLARILDVHVWGSVRLIRAAARAMVGGKAGGAILLHSAPEAFFGRARSGATAIAGGAIAGLVRSSAAELGKYDIRVNAIAPTARTRIMDSKALFQQLPEGALGPEYVGAAGAFLLSDLAFDVRGEIVGSAGGRLYAYQTRESPGYFMEGPAGTPEQLAEIWADANHP